MIKINNLKKSYGKRVILDNINIKFFKNKINFIMGKNGAGKTTIIKCILNLEKYYGSITAETGETGEVDIKEFGYDTKNIFAIFDSTSVYGNLTGMDHIKLFTNKSQSEIMDISLDYFNNDMLNKKAKTYSYGEKKKLFFIILELMRPKVIIMDEISNGLDYETMALLRKKIKELSKDSTIILTGHQFDFYRSIIDKLFLVEEGKITGYEYNEKDSLEDIYEKTYR